MYNTGWVKNLLLSEGSERRTILAVTLICWLFMFVVIAKMFLGCSVNLRQAILPFQEHFYKIKGSSSDGTYTVKKIALPSLTDGALSFLAYDDTANDESNGGYFNISANDISAIARIGSPSQTLSLTKGRKINSFTRSRLFHPIIDRAAAQYQVDPALVRAIIFAESGYNPSAVSKRGAIGLMQLMPGTAKAMGVEDCFDPEYNIYGGVKYFKKLFNQFDGDVKLALAAYNAGSRNVREFNGVPPFRATEHYIQKVLKYYKIFKCQQTEPMGLS